MRELGRHRTQSVTLMIKQPETSNGRPSSHSLWDKAHKVNELKSQLRKSITDVNKCKQRTKWENKKLENQIDVETFRRYQNIKSKEAYELSRKKENLGMVLVGDEREILKECKTSDTEKVERLQALRAQARLLEKQRKEKTVKTVHEKYDHHLRENFIELRQEYAKRRANEIACDLLAQIKMKQQQNFLEKQRNDFLDQSVLCYSKGRSKEVNKQTVVEGKKTNRKKRETSWKNEEDEAGSSGKPITSITVNNSQCDSVMH
ncbi:hypothetical protein MN116_001317 [Schistosoma mekongi]|uniref:Uncharacterized protein n=1 Tax=Schistosoma mekongi TaxID=38744 RepID=A0AAE2D9E1_SCHME|nr:hypothetical protein MN116_001317 [Schistosoma mekongi]